MLQLVTMYWAIGLMIFGTYEGRNMVNEVKELKASLPVAIFVTIMAGFIAPIISVADITYERLRKSFGYLVRD